MFDIMKNSRLYKFLRRIAGDEVTITPSNVFEDCLDDIADAVSSGGGSDLPSVTSADNGKVLKVSDGAWAAESERFVVLVDFDLSEASATVAEVQQAYGEGKTIAVRAFLGDVGVINVDLVGVSEYPAGTLAAGVTTFTLDYSTLTIGFNSLESFPWYISTAFLDYKPGHTLIDANDYPVQTGTTGDENGTILVKAYSTTGNNTDGTMTQAAITTAIEDAPNFTKIDADVSSHSAFKTSFNTAFASIVSAAIGTPGTRAVQKGAASCTTVTNVLALSFALLNKLCMLKVTPTGWSNPVMFSFTTLNYNSYSGRGTFFYNDGTNDWALETDFMIRPDYLYMAMTATQL